MNILFFQIFVTVRPVFTLILYEVNILYFLSFLFLEILLEEWILISVYLEREEYDSAMNFTEFLVLVQNKSLPQ